MKYLLKKIKPKYNVSIISRNIPAGRKRIAYNWYNDTYEMENCPPPQQLGKYKLEYTAPYNINIGTLRWNIMPCETSVWIDKYHHLTSNQKINIIILLFHCSC